MKRRISLSMSTSAMNAHENARCDHSVRVGGLVALALAFAQGWAPFAWPWPWPSRAPEEVDEEDEGEHSGGANAAAVEKGTAPDTRPAEPPAAPVPLVAATDEAAPEEVTAEEAAEEEEHWHSMRARSCGNGTCFRNMYSACASRVPASKRSLRRDTQGAECYQLQYSFQLVSIEAYGGQKK